MLLHSMLMYHTHLFLHYFRLLKVSEELYALVYVVALGALRQRTASVNIVCANSVVSQNRAARLQGINSRSCQPDS